MQSLALLEKLIAYPTVSSASNLALIDFVREYLQLRGFSLHQIDAPCGQKAGLFATIGPAQSGGTLLSAHTDVVPTQGQVWTRPQFALSVTNERAYGRGTTDMKGYLACMLRAADTASRAPLRRPLKLSISYDEEIGCVGIRHMIEHLEPSIGRPDLALVGEPTSMRVANGHKGKAAIRALCRGESGHSALAPKFLNALHLATDLVVELRALQAQLAQHGARDPAYAIPYSSIHVGKIQGGMALNIVPDTACVDFEYRHLATDNSQALYAQIQQISQDIVQRYRADFPAAAITLDRHNSYPGLDLAPEHPALQQALELAGHTQTCKVAFGTEAGYFDQLGIPTLVCGPGDMEGQGHKPDEYLALTQLAACDAMLDRVVHALCEVR